MLQKIIQKSNREKQVILLMITNREGDIMFP